MACETYWLKFTYWFDDHLTILTINPRSINLHWKQNTSVHLYILHIMLTWRGESEFLFYVFCFCHLRPHYCRCIYPNHARVPLDFLCLPRCWYIWLLPVFFEYVLRSVAILCHCWKSFKFNTNFSISLKEALGRTLTFIWWVHPYTAYWTLPYDIFACLHNIWQET